MFPGLVLVVLTISARRTLVSASAGRRADPIVLAGLPATLPDLSLRKTVPSVAWLPLLLALLAGYFAPDGLVHWWRILTAGGT